MFTLNSDITIGNFHFSGVNDVVINRSIHTTVDTATIKIPAVATIVRNGERSTTTVITDEQFNEGDQVTIKLGYNNDLQTEFVGFVKRKDMNMPLEVTCEGYSYLLKKNKVNISKTAISIKDLLTAAVSGIDSRYAITIKCDLDCALNNVQVNGTGFDVISKITEYTDGAATCFFIEPDILWCGLVKTAYSKGTDVFDKGLVQYRPGYNVFKNNTLKARTIKEDPVQVKYSKALSTGTAVAQTSDAFKTFARTHSRILNQVKNAPALKQLANEKAYSINYEGYEGSIDTFLVPYVSPGYVAHIADEMFKNRKGDYLVEAVQTHFGIGGARRKVEIGVKKGFTK